MRIRWGGALALALTLAACDSTAPPALPAHHTPPATSAAVATDSGRVVIYQAMTRLFGNTTTRNQPWGTREENGVGKFADFNEHALAELKALGATHIWYTGVLRHGLIGEYPEAGIASDDPDVIKGRAGSPYAIRDYYDVNPDLALDPRQRMAEFDALLARSHAAGLKVIIDIVPNHVARSYHSQARPEGVEDFGARDDRSVEYARDNNFYYLPGQPFRVPAFGPDQAPLGGAAHPLADGQYDENPARWTGNNVRQAQPKADDWYETIKLNYGVRPDGGHDFPALPATLPAGDVAAHRAFWAGREVPDTWIKMRQIVEFWQARGVDGFRFDMAEMVPVEFFSYLNSQLKSTRPDTLLIAEIYQPDLYAAFLDQGLMDLLYDKVDFYDQLRRVMQGQAPASVVLEAQERHAAIDRRLLRFVENHDEHRIAAPDFAGDARLGVPAMLVSASMGASAVLLYFGQEVGEPGAGDAGYGNPGRTTIFDYWGVPAHQRWVNGGAYDGGALSAEERALRQAYQRILRTASQSALFDGEWVDLHRHNLGLGQGYDERLLAYLKRRADGATLIVASFDSSARTLELTLPATALGARAAGDGERQLRDALGGSAAVLQVAGGTGRVALELEPLAVRAYEVSR